MRSIRESWIYHICRVIGSWLSQQWEGSALVSFMSSQREERTSPALLRRLFEALRRFWMGLFRRIRAEKWMQGSMFLHPAMFAGAAMVLSPILPTMAILALVGASFLGLGLRLGLMPEERIGKSPISGYILVYAAIYVYGTLTSVSLSGSLFPGMLSVAFVLFFFAVISCGFTGKQLDRLLWLMLAAGVLVAGYGFLQRMMPWRFRNVWTDLDMFSNVAFRVYSTLENPNVLGEYFLLVIPVGMAMTLTRRGLGRLLCGVATALMAVCLVLTYSRGCYLGILVAVAIFLLLLDRRFLLLGVVAVLFSPLYLPQSVLTRFTSIGNMGDSSTSYRVYIWLGTLAMLKDYWFSGVGPGEAAFNMVYPEYAYNAITAPHSHSLFLQLVCDLGICGLLVFLLLVVGFYRMMFTAIRREADRRARIFQIAGVAAISGFLIEGMTDYAFYNYRVTLLFWAMLGLCVQFTGMGRTKDAAGTTRVMNIITDSNIGGAGNCLVNYLKYCDRSRYTPVVVLPENSALIGKIGDLAEIIPAKHIAETSFSAAATWELTKIVWREKPDVVHTHGSLSGRIAGKLCGIRVVFTRHSAFPVKAYLKKGPGHWINGLVNSYLADEIIAVSPATRENLLEGGVPDRKITVMMNGAAPLAECSAEKRLALRQERNLPEGVFTAGILARLEPYKGHMLLLEAAKRLKEEGRNFRILICGCGPMEQALTEAVEAMGLGETVRLLGFVSNVAEIMQCLDVQLNCSYGTEASSLALIEGMSVGVPAIVSSYGGNPWMIQDGESGLIFENKNPEELAQRLRQVMDDPELLARLSRGARRAYETKYTGEIFAANVEAVYHKLKDEVQA